MRCFAALLASSVLLCGLAARAESILPPVSERFAADSSVEESPDFRRHVLPTMGRLGCNGRACHGSFQGQGGFQLSLFGYDFSKDHDALLKTKHLRVDVKSPEKSLILRKPTLQEDHEGGQRMAVESWQFRLLKKWIDDGAKPVAKNASEFERLELTPREIVFRQKGDTARIKVVAVWKDGAREEVTPICRFRTNDDGVCKIDEHGLVTAISAGDTHIVAFYDKGVQPIPVLFPVAEQAGEQAPPVANTTKIDELITAKLNKLGIVPSELCTDAEFLRRACLDITGTLPTPSEVEQFLADPSATKRTHKIDELLQRWPHAAWWAQKLCDWTGNNPQQLDQVFQNSAQGVNSVASQWYYWIEERLKENKPYDAIVAGLLLATSREPDQDYEQFCQAATQLAKGSPSDFATHSTMPYYWMRQNFRKPDEMAMGFAHTFMGLQIQCAQCHKHPFDQWTKTDFGRFLPFFTRVGLGVAPDAWDKYSEMSKETGLDGLQNQELRKKVTELIAAGQALPQIELFVGPPPGTKSQPIPKGMGGKGIRPLPQAAPNGKLLGAEEVDLRQVEDPRKVLLDWLLKEPNRYLARSFVNRVWGGYFHAALVNPPDDMNQANPPSNAPLLEYLTSGFIEHKYDIRWLHREIANSAAYQRSWRANGTNQQDNRNFSRFVPRRLPAEVAYDALVQATAGETELADLQTKVGDRAIGAANGLPGPGKRAGSNYVMTVFGKPVRATNCDCERNADPSLLQTIYLRNDQETLQLVDRAGGWARQAAKLPTDQIIRGAFLRTLSRNPTADEAEKAQTHLHESGTAGVRDLLWALINTKEFIVNH